MTATLPATPNVFDRFNIDLDFNNVVPKDDKSRTFKIWQRVCATFACLEVHERPKSSNETKFAESCCGKKESWSKEERSSCASRF
jgi:hypothetical protein